MDSNNNNNGNTNGRNDGDGPITNPQARVPPTPENPRGYPPFDLRLVPNYTNNQLTYYYTVGAIPAAEQARFHQLMKQRKTSLDLLGWDGESDGRNEANDSESFATPNNSDSEADSECPAPFPGCKGIKISPSDIPKLRYNSTIAQYNNWLVDLKTAFDGDPAKFPTSRQKIILASVTLDEQLKTTYNSATQTSPILSRHWRRFEQWLRETVLHGGSDKLKLSNEFTAARQTQKEDPNQFYIRLFNLGIQSGRTVTTEDYRTRLLKPLQNLMDQHDREYATIKDAVTHAGKLWQTLDRDKLRQEIKEEKEKEQQRQRGSERQPDSRESNQSDKRRDSQQGSRRGSRRDQERDHKAKESKPRLSTEEHQHRKEKNLCFNCGYPGHSSRDCEYPFNPNRVTLKDDSQKAKSQQAQARSKKRARVQPLRADSPTENESESETERPSKRQKN
jgi:hypothetical protein